jgi:hypothetical protein
MSYPPTQRSELLWAAIDFDGTIATSTWSPEDPTCLPGPPIWDNVDKLDILSIRYKIVVHTSRGWADYELIEAYLHHHRIPFDKIVCGKLLAQVYVDDRGINASELDWRR